MSEKFKARGTNLPKTPFSLPSGVDGIRYLYEKEVSALIGFSKWKGRVAHRQDADGPNAVINPRVRLGTLPDGQLPLCEEGT
jgi:hypothetical protein